MSQVTDEPAPLRRILGGLLAGAVLGGLLGVEGSLLGIGGWERGAWAFGALVGVPAAALTWWRLGSAVDFRAAWTASLLVLGFVAGAGLAPMAPMSSSRLSDRMDALGLGFYRQVSERHDGHGWCRPCPSVDRIYRANTAVEATALTVAAAVSHAEGEMPMRLIERREARLLLQTDDVRIRVVVVAVDGSGVPASEVRVRYLARR